MALLLSNTLTQKLVYFKRCVSHINEQRRLDLDYKRACNRTGQKMLVFHEIVMLGCNSSCSTAIVYIFKCLDWFGQAKVFNYLS